MLAAEAGHCHLPIEDAEDESMTQDYDVAQLP